MLFTLAFLLISGLEVAVANDDQAPEPPPVEIPDEPDMCVGCNDKEEEEPPSEQLTVEIRIDPVTGEVLYVIKGIVIE